MIKIITRLEAFIQYISGGSVRKDKYVPSESWRILTNDNIPLFGSIDNLRMISNEHKFLFVYKVILFNNDKYPQEEWINTISRNNWLEGSTQEFDILNDMFKQENISTPYHIVTPEKLVYRVSEQRIEQYIKPL